jgi:hypothetical protein
VFQLGAGAKLEASLQQDDDVAQTAAFMFERARLVGAVSSSPPDGRSIGVGRASDMLICNRNSQRVKSRTLKDFLWRGVSNRQIIHWNPSVEPLCAMVALLQRTLLSATRALAVQQLPGLAKNRQMDLDWYAGEIELKTRASG